MTGSACLLCLRSASDDRISEVEPGLWACRPCAAYWFSACDTPTPPATPPTVPAQESKPNPAPDPLPATPLAEPVATAVAEPLAEPVAGPVAEPLPEPAPRRGFWARLTALFRR